MENLAEQNIKLKNSNYLLCHEQTNQDGKVRFLNFGDSSLDVMVLYFVRSNEWDNLVDTQQEINFKIIEIVKKYGSDFAYPTTSVFLENQNN